MRKNPDRLPGLLDRKMLIVSGKGGVGKTTVSAILGRLAAGLKRRVLIIQSDPNLDAPVNLHNLLGSEPFGNDPRELQSHLWAVKMDPDAAMRYSFVHEIRAPFLFDAFFQNELIKGIADAVPGLREAFIVYHAHAMAMHGWRRHRFDLVVWDAPPTGHLPLYLKSPAILARMFNRGHVHAVLKRLADFLRHPERVALCLVTLPEETPVSETMQLVRQLSDQELGHSGALVVNAFPAPLLNGEEARDYSRLHAASKDRERFQDWIGTEVGEALLATARRRLEWEAEARRAILPLADLGLPQWTLPYFPSGRVGLKEVDQVTAAWLEDPSIVRHLRGEVPVEVPIS